MTSRDFIRSGRELNSRRKSDLMSSSACALLPRAQSAKSVGIRYVIHCVINGPRIPLSLDRLDLLRLLLPELLIMLTDRLNICICFSFQNNKITRLQRQMFPCLLIRYLINLP